MPVPDTTAVLTRYDAAAVADTEPTDSGVPPVMFTVVLLVNPLPGSTTAIEDTLSPPSAKPGVDVIGLRGKDASNWIVPLLAVDKIGYRTPC